MRSHRSLRLRGGAATVALLCAIGLTPVDPGDAKSQSADAIVAKTIAAEGGADRIAAVKTERLTGRLIAGGNESSLTIEFARALRMRMEIGIRGKTLVRAYDGSTGWVINPFAEHPAPERMSPTETLNISREADFEGPLANARAKGNTIALVGRDSVEGHPVYHLSVTLRDGTVDHYFIDAGSYLPRKWEGPRHVQGKDVVFESYFRDFTVVDGVHVISRIESDRKGEPSVGGQVIVIDHVELNVPLSDSRFTMPDSTTAPKR